MSTMMAARIHAYGDLDALVVEEVPTPVLRDNDLLVKVYAASVNPFDWKVRQGYLASILPYEMPLILGWDFSGVVEATGPGVKDFLRGDEVFGRADVMRNGTYAEYTAVSAGEVIRKPAVLPHTTAAAIPNAGLAAWRALVDFAELKAGQSVLIHGAAGGVGSFAVQFAKHLGAHVIGTASPHNVEFLSELGVDQVIDHTTTRFEDVVRDIDVVLDTMGGETLGRSWQVLKRGGALASLVEYPAPEMAESLGVKAAMVVADFSIPALQQITDLILAGTVKVVLSAVYPLANVREAHALSQSLHSRGKIVLQVR